jgi:hypothetical protein
MTHNRYVHSPVCTCMGAIGHDYDSPSSRNPGLLMFLVDKSLYSQQSNLMPVLREQIVAICKRFGDANKKKLFRLVICEFANAPQRRNHIRKRTVDTEVIFGRPIRRLQNVIIYEGIDESTYKFDRHVEKFKDEDSNRLFNDGTTVEGTNLKAALSQASNEVEYHHNEVVYGENQKPPISILMFSGNNHDSAQDFTRLPGEMGRKKNEYYGTPVDDFAKKLVEHPNVLFGVFNMHGGEIGGEKITVATRFSKEMIQKAIEAEARYAVPYDQRLKAIFSDPEKELIGRSFIFNQQDIQNKPKFLAALIRLGTSTILQSLDSEENGFGEEDNPEEGW